MSDDPGRQRRPRGRGARPSREAGERREYTVYRSRSRLVEWLAREKPDKGGMGDLREASRRRPRRSERRAWTVGRVVKVAVLAVAAWLALSLVLFLVSAQLEQGKVSSAAERALDSGGVPIFGGSTVLVLGSDARTAGTNEPGGTLIGQGPSRSDTIMLMRVGVGHNARLSIPRDTVANIPGHGQDKINAAYAIGGAALAVTTVKQFLGIKINHLVEVNFANFPEFIDALGGIKLRTGCVTSNINGGTANGGYTLKLGPGTHRLDGKQALALARTRKNECNPAENDLTRAKRQQQILSAMKSRLLSPFTFLRLPWVSWQAPKTIRSDMSGPSLLGMFAGMAVAGSPTPRVLEPSGSTVLPNGGSALIVSDQEKRDAVQRFLSG